MPRPGSGSGKPTIKGTRGNDDIAVTDGGVVVNGKLKPFEASVIDSGFILKGDAGSDGISGGRGADEIDGGRGNDMLTGGGSLDRISGGDGDDTLVDLDVLAVDVDLADGIDPNANLGAIFDGGSGIDTLDFSGSSVGVGAFLNLGVEPGITLEYVNGVLHVHHHQPILEGRITGVEHMVGSNHNDVLWGASGTNRIDGGGGDDSIVGLLGDDRLFGDAGNDFLDGSPGNDQLTGGDGSDIFRFEGDVTPSTGGHDLVLDYTPGQDSLLFDYSNTAPVWQPYSYATANDSLIGIYDNGASSVVVVGVTDPSQLTVAVTAQQGMWDVYHYPLPDEGIVPGA